MNALSEESLREEIAGLAVDDILALCYTFQNKSERLELYLDVLRRRGGERAQFCCTLICFDLARQGDERAQREFTYLVDTMRTIARKADIIEQLIGNDDYLTFLWDLCRTHLSELDPRFEAEQLEQGAETFAEVELLSDDDFADDDFGLVFDDTGLQRRFEHAVERFLGGEVGVPIYDPESGFRVTSQRDVERVEAFLQELESLRDLVPLARGFRALTLLFYGTHMRSKNIFGRVNKKKQKLLQHGLQEFFDSGPQMWGCAGVLSALHAPPSVWEKITDVLMDYLRWCKRFPKDAAQGPQGYDAVGRLIARHSLNGYLRRSRRLL